MGVYHIPSCKGKGFKSKEKEIGIRISARNTSPVELCNKGVLYGRFTGNHWSIFSEL